MVTIKRSSELASPPEKKTMQPIPLVDEDGRHIGEIPPWTQSEIARSARSRTRSNRPFTRQRREAFLEGVRCGLTTTAAADLVGVSRRNIYAVMERDETFRRRYEAARDIAAEIIEEKLEEIVMSGPKDSMAVVGAAEVLLKGRSPRYRPPQPGARAAVDMQQGTISVSIGTPGPD